MIEEFLPSRHGWTRVLGAAYLCLTCVALSCALGQTSKANDLPSPGQIADVVCASDSTHSYALYLPSAYSPAKRWPVIYFFDSAGRGRRPLDLYKDIAETYGFIFAGSNNSRNFASDESAIVNAIWRDTHLRLALDERRTYTSGFSGGARIAGAMALSCPRCQIAGVIAGGAGYPNNRSGSNDQLLYFFAVGNQDFNWPEVVTIRQEREDRGLPYRVDVFPGPHEWAPHAVMEDAVQWLVLKSMQAGSLTPDPDFIDHVFQKRWTEADNAEKNKDALAQFGAYRSLVSDFIGLRDTGEAAKKLAVLKQSDALKAAFKNERSQITEQSDIENELSSKINAYISGQEADATALRREILQRMNGLRDQAAHAKSEVKQLTFTRALDGLWVEGIETGQQALESRQFAKAEACFELMSRIRSNPWPSLLLADTHAAAGNKKQALKDLQEAVRHGLTDADLIESDRHLEILRNDPEFQRLVAELKHK